MLVCLAIIGWSCQSSNFDDMKKEAFLSSVEILSPLDSVMLMFNENARQEPFVSAIFMIYNDEMGKKLLKVLHEKLGDFEISFIPRPGLVPGKMRKTDLATIEYGPLDLSPNSKCNTDIYAGLICHELFHIYQCRVDGNLGEKKLNLEIEAYT